jgi:DNA-binding HxlR family transcriptional regulator
MMRLMTGAWVAQIIHTAAELGIADHLADGPRNATSLAEATTAHAPSLSRMLRALAAIGILHESEDRYYTLTPLGATLQTNVPGSMRAWARHNQSPDFSRSWQALLHAVRTGENAFQHVHGTNVWTYLSMHPNTSKLFDEAMQSITQGVYAAVSQHYPLDEFGWIIDVGGGNGSLLIPILERHLAMRGTVFDLPHVADSARKRIAAAGLAARCDAVGGDAFVMVPPGADAYMLKSVIHDWDDAAAVRILQNCRAAMSPHARMLLIERLLPERIDPDDALTRANFLNDMNMFVNPGGRERTEDEYRDLLARAGLQLTRITRTPSPAAVMEATPA